MLLEHKEVAPYLDAPGLHEKVVRKPLGGDKVGMAHKILTHELVAGRVGNAP